MGFDHQFQHRASPMHSDRQCCGQWLGALQSNSILLQSARGGVRFYKEGVQFYQTAPPSHFQHQSNSGLSPELLIHWPYTGGPSDPLLGLQMLVEVVTCTSDQLVTNQVPTTSPLIC